jgi:hypothetical protein
MQDVTEVGTARIARIPGINMCAKTGTAENYLSLEGKRTKLNNNSMFVCFAPRENPQIAIAVVIQNAGYGSRWSAPIGSLLVEKYLRYTTERVKQATELQIRTCCRDTWFACSLLLILYGQFSGPPKPETVPGGSAIRILRCAGRC